MKARLLLGFSALALAACLGACGGGGGGASSASSAETPEVSRSPPSPPKTANTHVEGVRIRRNKPHGHHKQPARPAREPHPPRALVRKAGHAAPFLVPVGDNSIPTFGSESTGSDRAAAEAALRAYLSARARGDWSTACTGLAASLRRQTQAFAGASAKAKGCAAAYQALAGSTPAASRADPLAGPVLALRIKGRSAFALFNGPKRQKYVMPMAREGGAWKATQLAPIAYPLGSETQTSP